jgi:hypothetical protein
MFRFFGGAPKLLVPNNLKSGVNELSTRSGPPECTAGRSTLGRDNLETSRRRAGVRELSPLGGARRVEKLDLADRASGLVKVSYSWSRSFLTAAIWRSEHGERQTSPALGGADELAKHDFEHGLLAEPVWNGFQPSPFFRRGSGRPVGARSPSRGMIAWGDLRLEFRP